MTECYSYLRVSGKSQVDGDGFPRQQAAVEAWAAVSGMTIVQEFRDEGVTGEADWENRPAFTDILGQILGNGVKVIVVENLTRLARNFVVQDTILTYLASRGVTLISADTGADVTKDIQEDPMKRALVQMQAVFSELEKNSIVRKLKAARARKKATTGRCEGRKPFGHRDGEPEVLDRMKALRADKLSFGKIAKALNEEEQPTRTGAQWSPAAVRQILNRELGVGK